MARVRDFIDSYRLVRLIRAGKTTQVWEAVRSDDDSRFALKILLEEEKKNREELAQLKREYEVAHGLKHPNVIKILEHKTSAYVPYLVLELFNSLNLKQALRERGEHLAPILPKVIEQAAEALFYVHTQGWLHCDVKPDNFLINEKGFVKLIDFSIAQRPRSGLSALFSRRATTQGTRSYMSPEQIRKQALDQRADLYSFACVLFELVAGRPPFTGDTPDNLLNRHLTAAIPSAIAHNENITREFNDLLKRMLAKKREQRPDTMWEFLKEFRAIQVYRKLPKPPPISDSPDEA